MKNRKSLIVATGIASMIAMLMLPMTSSAQTATGGDKTIRQALKKK